MVMIPEAVAIVGGILWGVAALVMAGVRGRVPSGYSFVFSCMATVGILIGLTRWTPAVTDFSLLVAAAVVYLATPPVFTGWVLYHYDTQEASAANPRTIQ